MLTRSFALQEQPYPDATALATAAWKGQVEKVKKLIKEGADVNERGLSEQKGFKPESPLQLAIDKASSFCKVPVRQSLLKSITVSCHCIGQKSLHEQNFLPCRDITMLPKSCLSMELM